MKCLKDKFLKLENFVYDFMHCGRLLKVIAILFRILLSLGAVNISENGETGLKIDCEHSLVSSVLKFYNHK